MSEYKLIPIETGYVKPGESLQKIYDRVLPFLEEGDYFVIAETPVSISQGRLIDESEYGTSWKSIFLADVWSKYFWGYFLGPLLGIKKRTRDNLKKLPKESRRHKEVVLKNYGWKHALKPASEAGIDLSNVPGTLVSMIPKDCDVLARNIARDIKDLCGKEIIVLIVDTDATYRFRNTYFTGLPEAINGIHSNLGVFAYFFGQIFNNEGSTPLGCSEDISVEKALKLSNMCEDYQKSVEDNLETVYSMGDALNSDVDDVTVDMLDSLKHTPVILVRDR